MKNVIILFSAIILLFGACNDEFLERYPLTKISDGNFWQSINDLSLYTNNFYNSYFPVSTSHREMLNFSYDANDGSDTQIRDTYNTTMNGERVVPASGGGWAAGDWAAIRNVNYFMDNYRKVNAPFDDIKQYAGEALFFRSRLYFDKLKAFGDVPFISTTLGTSSDALYDARLPRNQVVDSLMRDLDLAVEYLPSISAGWTGRLNRETAMLLQARIALYEGTWEKYHAGTDFGVQGSNGDKFLQKAADAAKRLMDAKTCDLDNKTAANGYRILFNKEDYSKSKEVLFWREFSVENNVYHCAANCFGAGGVSGITKSMVDSYLDIQGKPIAVSTVYVPGNETLAEIAANRDPRLAQTIYTNENDLFFTGHPDGNYFKYPRFVGQDICMTGYQIFKGNNHDYSQVAVYKCLTAHIWFRYAEALLIYAEARAELGSITQQDVDLTINELRKRAGMNSGLMTLGAITADPNWEFPELSPIINEVRRERKVELCCEGFRKDDIFRWAAADLLIAGKRPKGAKKSQWLNDPNIPSDILGALQAAAFNTDENGYIDRFKSQLPNGYGFKVNRDYLSPLPLEQMIINPKLKQNPGWK